MINPKALIEGLTEEFSQNPLVLAFTLVGSQAREDSYKAAKYSDMEAYVITKDEDAEKLEKELPDLVKKFGKVLFSFKHQIGFVTVYDDLFRLELPVIKLSQLKSLFSRPEAQVVSVLIDRIEGELEKVLHSRPETIDYAQAFADKITNFWYWQILGVQYFKKGEIYNTRGILNIHASALIKLFELLNNPLILLLETNKRIEQSLTKEQLKLLKEVTPAYNSGQIKKSLEKVMDIFSETAKAIKEKYGYSYDENLESTVRPKLLDLLSV
ncbi:MAG: aminoglycoside 6-adenylyltransferase [Candidatus Daviesbacteria bacterium]|nr:aminoglycoside 6-adenylyltransferase [Candidatus Daviesbacteria bacterium]